MTETRNFIKTLLKSTFLLNSGIRARRIFTSRGGEIDDVKIIYPEEVCYISQGENFIVPTVEAPTETTSEKYTIAILGAAAVGKSAITQRYVRGIFIRDYDPTIDDTFKVVSVVDGENAELDILDTAGLEDFKSLRSSWMVQREAFVLVYSVQDPESFKELETFYNQLKYIHQDKKIPIVLVGNKIDLGFEVASDFVERETREWDVHFIEASAKEDTRISEIFETLVRELRKIKRPKQTQRKKGFFERYCTLL